jgi:hypothetical protein
MGQPSPCPPSLLRPSGDRRHNPQNTCFVEVMGLEPTASSMRPRRSSQTELHPHLGKVIVTVPHQDATGSRPGLLGFTIQKIGVRRDSSGTALWAYWAHFFVAFVGELLALGNSHNESKQRHIRQHMNDNKQSADRYR